MLCVVRREVRSPFLEWRAPLSVNPFSTPVPPKTPFSSFRNCPLAVPFLSLTSSNQTKPHLPQPLTSSRFNGRRRRLEQERPLLCLFFLRTISLLSLHLRYFLLPISLGDRYAWPSRSFVIHPRKPPTEPHNTSEPNHELPPEHYN